MSTTLTTAEADARAVNWVVRLGLKTQYDLLEDALTLRYSEVLDEAQGDIPIPKKQLMRAERLADPTVEVVLPDLTVKAAGELTRDDVTTIAAFMHDFRAELVACHDGDCDCHTREIVD